MCAVAEPAGWPERLPSLVSTARTPAELAAELSAGLERVRQAAEWSARPPTDPSSYDILHERVCQLYLADTTFPSWWDAVNWAGEHFRAFRIEHKLDASGVAALLVQGRMAARTIQRAILGLPITFFFKSIFAELTSRGIDPGRPGARPRLRCRPRGGWDAHPLCSFASSRWPALRPRTRS